MRIAFLILKNFMIAALAVVLLLPAVSAQTIGMEMWLTKGDRSALLELQKSQFSPIDSGRELPRIKVDEAESFQKIDGFGYTLTGGSAFVIKKLPVTSRARLLKELFGSGKGSIRVSYLRISIGSSDLDERPFSYSDLPPGKTDPEVKRFDLSPDRKDLIPVLQAILKINPNIKIMASPWSAPVWMKDNVSSIGGSLQPKFYDAYARYFVIYLKQMKLAGIPIDAITVQNEPLHDGNNPSMLMNSQQQGTFIKDHLGPAFRKAGLRTKIVIYDHNCDRPEYPIEILNDPVANQFVEGSAFHLYKGEISAMTKVHDAHPDKRLYFTEQYTSSNADFEGDLKWHFKNVVIGSLRNWSVNVLEWNLASDEFYRPHTNRGCYTCQGAVTIAGSTITRNVSYYIIAHASKFIPAGSIRISSNSAGGIYTAAFKTPAGKVVLLAENDGSRIAAFEIQLNGDIYSTELDSGSVATYIWGKK